MSRLGETKRNPDRQELLKAGLAYLEGGLNLIPIDARKTPADPPLPYQKWKRYQTERVTEVLIRKWVNIHSAGSMSVETSKKKDPELKILL